MAAALRQACVAEHEELLHLIERHRLYGRGPGWIDVHLLGSGLLSSCDLWTSDRALREAAQALGIAARVGDAR